MASVGETDPELWSVLEDLKRREPIFHHPETGTTRVDFDGMMDPGFWEVGASGRRYSRDYVLEVLEQRSRKPRSEVWQTRDFHCMRIAADNYLLTYTLDQGGRLSRRATLWRRTPDGWRILYHQGTLVTEE